MTGLKRVPSELLDIPADLVYLVRDVDLLRTVYAALVAAYAAVCLTELRNCSVVAYKIRTAGLPVVLRFLAL